MSTGADCTFIEVEPGRWSYRIQRWPYGDTPEYDKYGPFPSFQKAQDHLDENHANPGGWSVTTHAQHRHEWTVTEGAHVPAGVEVTIRIESLGVEPSKEAILAHLKAYPLTPDHLRVTTVHKYDPTIRTASCEACGEIKERAS